MAGVDRELWTGVVAENYIADPGFLSTIADESAMVQNRVIHLAELGVTPQVLLNNNVYPIPTNVGNLNDLPITLESLSTTNTAIREDYLFTVEPDVIAAYTKTHVRQLREFSGIRASYNIAPSADATNTPVILTTGDSDGNASSRKRITKNDILNLRKRFDLASVPEEDRILVLCPEHLNQILGFDENFADQYSNRRTGQVFNLWGFQTYMFAKTPLYTGGNKKAFGTAPAPATECYSSVAYSAAEVFKAMSDLKMHYRLAENDPENRANIIGFGMYFITAPRRPQGLGAIVSPLTA